MSRADLIPLALLRDLAARLPDPIRPASFVDLAVFVSHTAPDATKASALPPPRPEARSDAKAAAAPAPGSVTIDKKGLPWALDELTQARELLTSGKGPSEVARILGRPMAATRIAIKRYGVCGTDPIKAPGRPKGRIKKADPGNTTASVPVQKANTDRRRKVVPDAKPAQHVTVSEPSAAVGPVLSRPLTVAPKPAPAPKAAPAPKVVPASATRSSSALNDAVADKLTSRQLALIGHLIALPATFTRADDLYLAEGISQRRPTPEMVDQLGVEAPALIARWKNMAPSSLSDRSGHLMADFRGDMIQALRWLVEWEARPHA